MKILIDSPNNFSKKQLNQLIELIISGSQVNADGLMDRILKAYLIAVCVDQNQIIASVTIKNPAISYRNKVFKKAGVSNLKDDYLMEIGYIVTDINHRGEKLCQKILTKLIPKFKDYNIFATTRKPDMLHILKKFRFQETGKIYNNDLHLFIFRPN